MAGRITQSIREDQVAAAGLIASILDFDICVPFRGVVIETDGAVTGAVIFNGYEPHRNVWITVVSVGPVSRRVVRDICYYVFTVLDCTRCSMVTRESNSRARRALGILGFREEGVMREWFGTEAGILYGLTRHEQKFVAIGDVQ